MDRSILAAVSGINANQTYLDTIGNNIANVNTVGYKSASSDFVDLLNQLVTGAAAPGGPAVGAGINPVSIGSGVRIGAISTNFTQGSIEQTNVPTDVAIQGNGFLVVRQGGQTYYTRAGNLVLDANGELATPTGGIVEGWQASSAGTINTNAPTSPITIPTGEVIAATATTEITVGGNLPAWSGSGTVTPVTTTIDSYDSLGNPVPLTLTFTPVSGTAGEWTVQGTVPGASKSLWNTPATVQFNTSTGQLASITNNDTGVTVTPNLNGSYSLPVTNMPSNYTFPTGDTWNIDFPASGSGSALTQFAGENTAAAVSQDGNAGGTLQSFSIGSSGVITGSFSNGQTLALGQIALASFANPGGLTSIGSLNYAASPNSGQPLLGPPGSGGRGTLIGGSLETSNVNLARQLTDLIIAQEAYQANTKVVATSSQVIQALVSMP